jgi:branched-chain amino acid transport system substrate-binding protein
MRQIKKFAMMALVLVVLALPVACAKPSPPPTPTPEQPAKTLVIGNFAPLQAKEGIQIKNWLQLLADRLNEKGGLVVKGQRYNVKVITYDDQYTADAGRACAERLVYEDKVNYIVGVWASAPIVAALSVTEPNEVLMIGDGSTEKTLVPEIKYFYRVPTITFIQGSYIKRLEWWKSLGLPMTCVLVNPDSETGHSASDRSAQAYKALGVEVLDALFYKADTTDFAPVATKINSYAPGFVDTGTTTIGSFGLCKALYEVGYRGGALWNNISGTWKDIVQKIGPEALGKAVSVLREPRLTSADDKEVMELSRAYEARYGVWETDSVEWVVSWFAFIEAVKKADSLDPDDLCKALDGMTFKALTSGLTYTFIPRPDLRNVRTAESCADMWLATYPGGELKAMLHVSAKENFDTTIKVLGMEKAYADIGYKFK